MTKLSVNLNKVALLRNQRDLDIPSVARAARICIGAGAHGITVHPRPDGRHIRTHDVLELSGLAADHGVEYNIEGNPTEEFLSLVERVRPTQCTLVPDSPDQRTSDHGWDLAADGARLRPIVERLHAAGTRVSLFMDPVPSAMRRAAETGTDRVELYTEPYARRHAAGDPQAHADYAAASDAARDAGLGVNAGHDLNLQNLGAFVRRVGGVLEVSIGHALIADALEMGLAATVRAYIEAIGGGVASGARGGEPHARPSVAERTRH